MQDETLMYKALNAWQGLAETESNAAASEHLDEHTLYNAALPGGLGSILEEELEHLSLCPLCLKQWASWLESLKILADESDEASEQGGHFSVGQLKAASASLFPEPLSLDSACGRFELSIYPDRDQLRRGMIVLETKKETEVFEQRLCVVRDGKGTIILRGPLEDGRLAGRLDDLSQIDLKTWTVIFD